MKFMKTDIFKRACRYGVALALCAGCFVSAAARQQPSGSAATTSATPAAAAGAPADDARAAAAGDQYRIGPRDVLTIRVAAPEIVQQFSADSLEVNECGMIPLLSVQNEERNEVRAAGLTT